MPPLKQTANNSIRLDSQDNKAASPQDAAQVPPQARIALLPAPNLPTWYANAFQTAFQRGEILLTACVSRQEADSEGPLLTVQPQLCLGMAPESAKRLAAALAQAVSQYEQQHGAIAL